MAIECLVITFILGAIVFSFARADRIRWVIATVPLGILPLANCVSCFVCTAFLGCELPKNIAAVILSCGDGIVRVDRHSVGFSAYKPYADTLY